MFVGLIAARVDTIFAVNLFDLILDVIIFCAINMATVKANDLTFQKLYSHEHIQEVVTSLAKQINQYYD